MADAKFNQAKESFFNGEIDLVADTIKVALFPNSYTANIDTDQFWSNISSSEITGTGYTAGGETLGTKSVTQDNTNDVATFDAADVTWTTATFTARYAILYKDTGTPSTSPLIAQFDFGSDQSPSGVDFTLVWNANGIMDLA